MTEPTSQATELMLDSVSDASAQKQLEVIVVTSLDNNAIWRRIPLGADATTIGRDASAPVAVADRRMSREHAIFEWNDDACGPQVRDLTSSNGTFVDGKRRQAALLEPGTIIRMGSTCMVVREQPTGNLPLDDSNSALKGRSGGIASIRKQVQKVAQRDAIVLVTGETGTGKEVVAHELHRLSARHGQLVAINCAAIAETLVESTLFGHKKGAFSGAHESRDGLFVQAHQGTLFLDEIGELPMTMQAKLLRVLQDFMVTPIGGNISKRVDVRVIAATNVPIKHAVKDNRFRADLLARLKEWPVDLPPLRERKEDICYLFNLFLAQDNDGQTVELNPLAAEALLLYDWPMNVREVQKLARRISAELESEESITLEMLPDDIREEFSHMRTSAAPQEDSDTDVDRETVDRAMQKANGKVARAARLLNVSRKTMYSYFKKFDISVDQYR